METGIHVYIEKKNNAEKWIPENTRWRRYFDSYYLPYEHNNFNFDGKAPCAFFLRLNSQFGERGIPEDSCKQIRLCANDWKSDAYGYSHVLLSELLAIDLEEEITVEGILGPSEYERLKNGIVPSFYFNLSFSKSSRMISEEEMTKYINSSERTHSMMFDDAYEDSMKYLCKTSWNMKIKDAFPWSLHFIEKLTKIEDPEKVRIVYWFDN